MGVQWQATAAHGGHRRSWVVENKVLGFGRTYFTTVMDCFSVMDSDEKGVMENEKMLISKYERELLCFIEEKKELLC